MAGLRGMARLGGAVLRGSALRGGGRAGRKCCYQHAANFHTSYASQKSYYEILGVSKDASQKDIKKAYYKMAKKYHPDVNKDDPEAEKKFSLAAEAYESLGDEDKRATYDSYGASGPSFGEARGPAQGTSGYQTNYQNYHGNIDPEELFKKMFGGFDNPFSDAGPAFQETFFGSQASKQVTVKLSFSEAARGVSRDIPLNVIDLCPKCEGDGCMPGTCHLTCHQCHGSGVETLSSGPFVMRQTCRLCAGKRILNPNPCNECMGKGRTVQRTTVAVQVPAGISDGQTLRISVGGEEVFINVTIEPSRYFRREGSDVHTDHTVSLMQAVLGGTAKIEGVYEDITIEIPPGTPSHSRMVLAGKGMKKLNRFGHGDHVVNFKIQTPTGLTAEQRSLFEALAELETDTPGTITGMARTAKGRNVRQSGEAAKSEEAAPTGWLQTLKKKILG